jgi:hypothetical protein
MPPASSPARATDPDRTAGKPPAAPWRTVGFWLAAAIAGLQAFNAIRAAADPSGFAAYMGVPLDTAADAAWVHVYALRTAFIALMVAALLATGNMRALAWIALAGVVMPVGDAWLAQQAGAPAATLARHAAIGVYLVVTFAWLRRWTRRGPAA